jgi:hypothetical protein
MSPNESTLGIRLRISLAEIDPLIWRTVVFHRHTTLHELHRGIQILFGWYDYHLYQFEIEDRRFAAPDVEAEGEDATKAKLSRLISGPGMVFRYTYDFGDGWIHNIEVEDTAVPADEGWIPWVVDGARSGPPEDCGGPDSYSQLVAALRRPLEDLEDEDRSFVDWTDRDFDPDDFNVMQARHALLLCSAWGVLRRRR